jgi:hypothetical protein
MKINEILTEMGTSAGAVAAVAQPLGGTISRNMGVYSKPKKKKKSKK